MITVQVCPDITLSGLKTSLTPINLITCQYRSVEASLERLQTSYIDLLYTHVWDEGTPVEETLETLGWLVQQGKVN